MTGDHDAPPVRRSADAATLVAANLRRWTDRGTAGDAWLRWWVTEEFDATASKRSADAATLVATVFALTADAGPARFTAWLLWRAIFIGADLTKSYAEAATLVAAVLPRTTRHLIARLAEAKILRAGNVVWNADATALWATGRTFDTENCRAWILVDRTANSIAVRPARGWIAAVTRIVNALEACRAG